MPIATVRQTTTDVPVREHVIQSQPAWWALTYPMGLLAFIRIVSKQGDAARLHAQYLVSPTLGNKEEGRIPVAENEYLAVDTLLGQLDGRFLFVCPLERRL